MKRSVFLWAVVLIGVVCTGWMAGCRDDVTVPFPPDIRGNYEGIYSWRITSTTSDTLMEQLVTFRFTATTFTMIMDGSVEEPQRIFCDVMGDYDLGTGVEMETTDSNLTRATCTETWCPEGAFSLDQTTDTTRLTRIYTDDDGSQVTVRLRLVAKTP